MHVRWSRGSLTALTLVLLATSPASVDGDDGASRPAAPTTGPAAAAPGVDDVLAGWERLTRVSRSFEAAFGLVRHTQGWDEDLRFEGWAKLAAPDKASVQIALVGENGREVVERVVCTGKKVYKFDHATKQIFIYPQDGGGRPSAWNDVVFFLQDVKADEVKKRFAVTLVKVTPKSYFLQAFPRRDAPPSALSRADLVLDRNTFNPSYLLLVDVNGKDTETFRFSKVARDRPISPSFFVAKPVKDWSVVDFAGPEVVSPTPGRPLPPPIFSRPADAPGVGK